jgi:hypothetical protein
MSRAFRSFLFAFLCLAAGTWLLCSPRKAKPNANRPAPEAAEPAAGASAVIDAQPGTSAPRIPN